MSKFINNYTHMSTYMHYNKKHFWRPKLHFSSLKVVELATKMELVAKIDHFCRLKEFSRQI